MNTYIIAEAACTWLEGGLDEAKRSISEAARCGASAWKTQWCSDSVLMHQRRGILGNHYSRLAWPKEWHEGLKDACNARGIDYLCTVFLPSDVSTVSQYAAKGKVAAFEYKSTDLIEAWMNTGKEVIQSLNAGVVYDPKPSVKYLYCVSNYPTKYSDAQLWNIPQGYSGYSDHTTNIISGAIAVALGAKIIEKHVRLDGCKANDPDYGHSLVLDSDNPLYSFKKYVDNIKEAEELIG